MIDQMVFRQFCSGQKYWALQRQLLHSHCHLEAANIWERLVSALWIPFCDSSKRYSHSFQRTTPCNKSTRIHLPGIVHVMGYEDRLLLHPRNSASYWDQHPYESQQLYDWNEL